AHRCEPAGEQRVVQRHVPPPGRGREEWQRNPEVLLARGVPMRGPHDAVVIGAGQAGLATGYHLQRAGLRFVLLEANRQAGGSWPRYYDGLTLFSPARYSGLPGLPFPGDPDRYPTRDEVVAYLHDYAAAFDLPVVADAKVQRVERSDSAFLLRTA